MSDLLAERLRRDTAGVHQHLEDTLDLMRDDLALRDYVGVLRAFYGFVAPWEADVEASGCVGADELALRRHAEKLAADLRHFGEPLDGIARADALPALDSAAAVLGSRYVFEGATLGARVVGPHLQRRFGLDAAGGCAWFGGYGERTGPMWRAFRAQLSQQPAHTHDAVVAGALDTFDTLARWLRRALPAPGTA